MYFPGYTRIRTRDILNNKRRKAIYDLILTSDGISYTGMKTEFCFSNLSDIPFHCDKLLKARLVKKVNFKWYSTKTPVSSEKERIQAAIDGGARSIMDISRVTRIPHWRLYKRHQRKQQS